MRWTIRILILLAVAWIAFSVSPYIALYNLSRTIERRDAAELAEAVNFRAFRLSLTKQLVGSYLDHVGESRDMSSFDKKLATEAAATVADPLVAQLLTPQAMLDLMDDGWPQGVVAKPPERMSLGFDARSLRRLWSIYANAQTRGFRVMYFTVPPEAGPADRYRIEMRLNGFRWRLSGLELPPTLRTELMEKIPVPSRRGMRP
jgi:hypothetical protein